MPRPTNTGADALRTMSPFMLLPEALALKRKKKPRSVMAGSLTVGEFESILGRATKARPGFIAKGKDILFQGYK